jgi:hypothetical protein
VKPRFLLTCAALAAGLITLPSAAQSPAEQHPNFSGTYLQRGPGAQTFNGFELTQEGQAAFDRNKAGIAASDPEIDTALRCEPQGVPRMLSPGPLPFVVMHAPTVMGVVSEAFAQPRLIFFATEHRKGYWPTYMGDSIAHWEGNELVIDTVNFIPTTFLDMRGLPHSDALHVTERMQLLDEGKALQDQVTIDDPRYFKKPFTLTHQYARRDDIKIVETVCLNTRAHP